MSLEIEDQWPPQHPADANHEFQKKDKVLYSRDFLLSLSELDACKNLPCGIDLSVLSEINNASNNLQDRKRVSGSFSSQIFRCGEYGSSPPTREDLSSYSRGTYGRWDGRSNGRLDGDNDNNSDWNAESGKRFGYQSRRSWKTPEHDGLLGSGSLPRPSECADASKVRAHDNYQMNRSSEPYHPPRPYKAVSHPAKEAKDSYNDETFGSSNSTSQTSQDIAEEERRRRDSFESMRKQQKALLEKQKLNPDQNKGKLVSDIFYLLEDSNDNKEITNVGNALDGSQIEPGPPNFLGKSHYPLKASASRPLVPPGFTSGVVGMNFETRSSSRSVVEEEVDNIKHQEQPLNAVDNPTLGVASVNYDPKQLVLNADCEGETMDLHARHVDNGENIMKSSSTLEGTNELNRMNDEPFNSLRVLEPFDTLEDGDVINLDSEKGSGHGIGGGALSQEQSTPALEKLFGIASMINDGGRSRSLQNDNIDEGEIWSPKTTKGSRFAHWFLEEEKKALDDHSSSRPSDLFSLIVGGDNIGNSHMSTGVLSSTVEISEQLCSGVKPDGVAAVLRCEDLEKSILSEASENGTNLRPSIQDLGIINANAEQPSGSADDHASWHLLSLLQKGPALQEIAPSSDHSMAQKSEQHKIVKDNDSSQGGQTLESLFGSAFMKELHDSVGSARIDGGEAYGLPSSMVNDGAMRSSKERENKQGTGNGGWLGFDDDVHNAADAANLQIGAGLESKTFVAEERLGISPHLPFANATGASQLPWLPNACVGISEQLPFQCNPYTLHPQSSPQFITAMNHGRPEFHSLDSRFPPGLLPDQIHGNMVRPFLGHPSARVWGFDPQNHHHVFDQMLMRGHTPHDLVQGLARNHVMGFVEEPGMLPGFPYGRQDLSLCIPGMSSPGGDVGGVGNNQPELLQRLLGMEPGSELKQAGRFPTTGGVYSDELEAGFRY